MRRRSLTPDGDAIVFLGNSGSGKSSLALQLIEHGGYEFLSNDRVLMRAQKDRIVRRRTAEEAAREPGHAAGQRVASRLVPRPRRQVYEQLPREELWQLEEKTDVDVQEHLGARSHLQAPLGRIYSLEWRPGGSGLEQRDLDPEAALAALHVTAKDFGPYDLRGVERDAPRQYGRIARVARFIGVTGRADPQGFAKRFAQEQAR